ncbi:MAG: hypothetical protein R3C19_16360 [Planctomycetaceae bacterium]
MSPKPRRRGRCVVIPILGMHRSGTSMVARALNLMGLELGQPLLEATPDNPHGYWENTFFVQVNAELLQTLRCDPDGFAPPEQLLQLPKLYERVVVENHRREQIRQFIRDGFSSSVWGWKDPRTVLTFGVWQRLLTEFGYSDIRPVVVVRHPETAMRSLIRARAGHGRRSHPERRTGGHGRQPVAGIQPNPVGPLSGTTG